MDLRHRLVALLGAVAVGAVVGTLGYVVTGSQWWFVAVPACMAGAWLFVADPTQCMKDPASAPRRPR